MVKPALRSSSLRKVYKSVPGGGVNVHYSRRKPGAKHCALCHAKLGGTLRLRPSEDKNTAKTKHRPERMYGGVLCPSCLKEVLKCRNRVDEKFITKDDVSITKRRYI